MNLIGLVTARPSRASLSHTPQRHTHRQLLAWQTERLGELAVAEDGWTVRVRPELVVEVAFDGVQQSPRYPGGLALRFARVVRYREDKRVEEADTIDTVRAIFEAARGRE
jgi:DNA ligase-1